MLFRSVPTSVFRLQVARLDPGRKCFADTDVLDLAEASGNNLRLQARREVVDVVRLELSRPSGRDDGRRPGERGPLEDSAVNLLNHQQLNPCWVRGKPTHSPLGRPRDSCRPGSAVASRTAAVGTKRTSQGVSPLGRAPRCGGWFRATRTGRSRWRGCR